MVLFERTIIGSWLVANIELIMIGLTLALCVLTWMIGFVTGMEKDTILLLFVIEIGVGAFCSVILRSGGGFAVLLLLFILLHYALSDEMFSEVLANHWKTGLLFLLIPLLMGAFAGRYAFVNYEDVVSRRYLFRHSKSEVFSDSVKYAGDRFVCGFFVGLGVEIQVFVVVFSYLV